MLFLLEWAVALGCKPPRRMSSIVSQLELDINILTAPYHNEVLSVTQLPDGAIVPPRGTHTRSVKLARTASGSKLSTPLALTADELGQVVYCRPRLWTAEIGGPHVGHAMWHVLFAPEDAGSTAFTLSRLLDVIGYFVGYFKPRQRAADWRHVKGSVWNGVLELTNEIPTVDVWLFQHTPAKPRAPSVVTRLKGAIGLSRESATTPRVQLRRFKEHARVIFDDGDEDLQYLVVRRAPYHSETETEGSTRGSGLAQQSSCRRGVGAQLDEDLNGRNVHGHLLHFSPAASRGDMLASMLSHFEI